MTKINSLRWQNLVSNVAKMRLNFATGASAVLILLSLSVAAAMIRASSERELTSLEEILFQVIVLGAGLSGSFIFGRSWADMDARETVRLHARPVFRRVLDLYHSLYRLSVRVGEFRMQGASNELDVIQAIVDEQIITGESSLEDWRDIAPDVVEELENLFKRLGIGVDNDDSD